MKSLLVHLKNKYPECLVQASGSSISVIGEGNELLCELRKGAHGAYEDVQHEVGARDAFDLSPIPKESRLWKLDKEGNVRRDELHDERKEKVKEILKGDKVPSIKEIESK